MTPEQIKAKTDEYMAQAIRDWPDGLKSFVDYRQKRYGICAEVLREAIRDFVSEVAEDMHWEDDNFHREIARRDRELDAMRSALYGNRCARWI